MFISCDIEDSPKGSNRNKLSCPSSYARCFKLDLFLILFFCIENACPILHPHIVAKVGQKLYKPFLKIYGLV